MNLVKAGTEIECRNFDDSKVILSIVSGSRYMSQNLTTIIVIVTKISQHVLIVIRWYRNHDSKLCPGL